MILDANVLIHAADVLSPFHQRSHAWLRAAYASGRRLGFPWQSIGAFHRITTHPRLSPSPMTHDEAHAFISAWLTQPAAWIPSVSKRTVAIYASLASRHHVTGNLVPDAQLAALALEHSVPVVSFDGDFARFTEIQWINPLHP
ncbi:MAG: PIN domain-containing protein [Arachnia propionica]|uniref:TA system VapC family ribonuclease toxin n=1 Tax=Arachnia propionica TaxID=1750 RepID=UPI00270FF9E8|nr:PIN domain-containing protein [Arachnia propionica]